MEPNARSERRLSADATLPDAPWSESRVFEFPPVLGRCPVCHTRLFGDDDPVYRFGRVFHPECFAHVRFRAPVSAA